MAHIVNIAAMTDGYITFICIYLQYKFSKTIYKRICHCCHSCIIKGIYAHIRKKKFQHEIRVSMTSTTETMRGTTADETVNEVKPFI